MRNPLDLNNFPDDLATDHHHLQPLHLSSLAAPPDIDIGGNGISCKRRKTGGKDESRKVYECRFCSLTFGKSQALGGHMNRHRQERERETLNRARQLVFGKDNLYQLGGQHGDCHNPTSFNMSSALYPTRLFSGVVLPPSRLPYSSGKDCFLGNVCSSNPQFILQKLSCSTTSPPGGANNYTCIGAPVGQAFTGGSGGGRDMSLSPI